MAADASSSRFAGAPPSRTEMAQIEREAERAALAEAVGRLVERGAGGVAVVEAAAGIGKSMLLDDVSAMAADFDTNVRRAAPGPLERRFPNGVLRGLLEAELWERAPGERARLLEGPAATAGAVLLGGDVPGPDAGPRIAHGVVRLCAALARERPLVLVVDDAQWADRPSLEVLTHLSRRIADLPLLLVVAHRPGDPDAASDLLALVGAAPSAFTLRPQPLSVAGAVRLIRRIAPDTAIHIGRRCHEDAAGNPWLLGELGRRLRDGDAPAMTLSAGARQVVRQRLAGLSAAARSLVVAIAVVGATDREVVAAVAGLELADLGRVRDELVSAGLLGADRRRIVHALVATAILDERPTAHLDDLHRRAARRLADQGAPSDVVAGHLMRCAPLADPEVTPLLRRAAIDAWQHGTAHDAAAYLQRALEERAPGDPRAELLARLSTAAFDAGRPGARERLVEALAAAEDRRSRVDILTRLATAEVAAPDASPLAERIDTERRAESDPEVELALEAAALDVLLTLPDRHAERARRVEELAVGAASDPLLRDVAQAHRAVVALERGTPDARRVARMAREALADGRLLAEARRRAGFHLCVRALVFTDQVEEAREAIDAMQDEARARGSVRLQAGAGWYGGVLALRAGRVTEAEAQARAAPALGGGGEPLSVFASGALEVLIGALAERGAFAEADALLAEHDPEVELLHARAHLALARGDFAIAYNNACAAGERCSAQGRTNPTLTPWRSTAALALAHSGRRGDAAGLADEELRLAERFNAPLPILTALHARAVAEADGDARLALLHRGAAVAAVAPPSLAGIRLLLEEGSTLRRAGRRIEARDPLRRALAVAATGGASLAAQHARRELVATGARPRRDQHEGAGALTPRQREISELAARGASNQRIADQLFLSIKTVEAHLASAFRKLDVTSRAEVAAALGEQA